MTTAALHSLHTVRAGQPHRSVRLRATFRCRCAALTKRSSGRRLVRHTPLHHATCTVQTRAPHARHTVVNLTLALAWLQVRLRFCGHGLGPNQSGNGYRQPPPPPCVSSSSAVGLTQLVGVGETFPSQRHRAGGMITTHEPSDTQARLLGVGNMYALAVNCVLASARSSGGHLCVQACLMSNRAMVTVATP